MRLSIFMLVVASVLAAMPLGAQEAQPQKPDPQGPVLLTADYVRENQEYFAELNSFMSGHTQFSLYRDVTSWAHYLTVIEYSDNTRQAIVSATEPPEYLVDGRGNIRVHGQADVFSFSPSDHQWGNNSRDGVTIREKDATMDFQTTLFVRVEPDRTLTINSDLVSKILPVQSMMVYELTEEAQREFSSLRWDEKVSRVRVHESQGYQRRLGRLHFSPAVTWDLGFIIGLAAVTDNGGFVPPFPGVSFLRGGQGTGLNITGVSVWLASAKDGKFRLAKFGVGLGFRDSVYQAYDDNGDPTQGSYSAPALTLQFAPIGIAFGPKEHWATNKAYTYLDRLRRHVYLDVGVNAFIGNGKLAWGPYVQTSLCFAHCRP